MEQRLFQLPSEELGTLIRQSWTCDSAFIETRNLAKLKVFDFGRWRKKMSLQKDG